MGCANLNECLSNCVGGGDGTDTGDYRKGSRMLGKGMPEAQADEQVDEFGRVNKGPFTLRNGATYTG
jgi:hypothetical protein